ncbi:MAG: transporter substrate-binding domain-containing protein [Clostridia bacterium]|nr:transporter substrate-binding domain-containing protein [Clostridia bacterium]
MGRGEVDLIPGVASNAVLPVRMEYASQPIGHESCNIYKLQQNDAIKPGYASSFIGKKVGVLRNSPGKDYMADFIEENAISCEMVVYDDVAALSVDLESGAIDAFASMDTSVVGVAGIVVCLTIGENDYYVCVSPAKRTLLRELNEADARLRSEEPRFFEQLNAKYYHSETSSVVQSADEAAWIRVHGMLRIGFLKDYLPFCGLDENG